jgi:hypothetical protein
VKYQIRDTRFGLALREGDNALDVLTDFLHVRERADVRNGIKIVNIEDGGTVEVNYKGLRLYAVPVEKP